jgi:hypothetical protein
MIFEALLFQNIKEFIGVKDTCVFCRSKLKVVLTNFIKEPNGIPVLKAKVANEQFNFNIKHTTESYQIEADATIDIITNALQFKLISPIDLEQYALDYMVAKTAFENLKPHIELYCPNKKCKLKYHICSNIFAMYAGDKVGTFIIKPLSLYMESFVVDKLWVQNDWTNNSTNIYSIDKANADPIRTSFIDLESMSKEKILTRIKTLVTFS